MTEGPGPQDPRELAGDLYSNVVACLSREFAGIHATQTVTRCVDAARHGAQEVTGAASPGLVERIARKHLQVLALAAAEHG